VWLLDTNGVALYRSPLCIVSVALSLLLACDFVVLVQCCRYYLAIDQASVTNLVVKGIFLWTWSFIVYSLWSEISVADLVQTLYQVQNHRHLFLFGGSSYILSFSQPVLTTMSHNLWAVMGVVISNMFVSMQYICSLNKIYYENWFELICLLLPQQTWWRSVPPWRWRTPRLVWKRVRDPGPCKCICFWWYMHILLIYPSNWKFKPGH
jgi:hypothetical protein